MRVFLAGTEKNLLPIIASFGKTRHKLVVMDPERHECERIADLTGMTVIRGDPTSLEALMEAHIGRFDLVVAVMDTDAENLMICDIAKRHLAVRHTLASVNRPYLEAVLKQLGVDEALGYPELVTHLPGAAAI